MGSVQSKSYKDQLFGTVGSFLEYDELTKLVKKGDLIEVHRGTYRHWVICESIDSNGTVWCFHVTPVEKAKSMVNIFGESEYYIGSKIVTEDKAVLKYESIDDILRDTPDQSPSKCHVTIKKRLRAR